MDNTFLNVENPNENSVRIYKLNLANHQCKDQYKKSIAFLYTSNKYTIRKEN